MPEPCRVERVDLKLTEGEVHVYLTHDAGVEWLCPECGRNGALYDRQPERLWRHLDTCQYRTILYAAPPRSKLPGTRGSQREVALGGTVEPVHRPVRTAGD
ncbi:MAG: transposase family protein [Acidobacteriota bacterium]|nr:transposase family protein [Acidobacteriota bacterium]